MPELLLFWLPLALTWLMMAVEGPFLSAVVARLEAPKINLAAYGVALSLAILIEAPIIMMMSASNALVKDRQSYRALRAYAWTLNGLLTAVLALLVFSPLFDLLALWAMNLRPDVALLARQALIILIPWPAAIGFRRFYQGLLVSDDRTWFVAMGTVVRFVAMGTTGLILYFAGDLPGVHVAAWSFTVGVLVESGATWLMSRRTVRTMLSRKGKITSSLGFKEITIFYFPLAITPVITLAVHPLVTLFLGQSRESLNSLAVMPVVNGFVFLFTGLALSVQEVVVALDGRGEDNTPLLTRFAWGLAAVLSAGIALVVTTPLSALWFSRVSGLSVELTLFAALPVQILALQPGLSTFIAFLRGLLVNRRRTTPISSATVLEVAVVLAGLCITIFWWDVIGAVGACAAMIAGRFTAVGYLAFAVKRQSRFSPE